MLAYSLLLASLVLLCWLSYRLAVFYRAVAILSFTLVSRMHVLEYYNLGSRNYNTNIISKQGANDKQRSPIQSELLKAVLHIRTIFTRFQRRKL